LNARPLAAEKAETPFGALVPFLLIAFGVAWGVLGLFILRPEMMTRLFGPLTGQHPLFYLAVYAPALAAGLIVFWQAGLAGLKRFLSRLLLWRCNFAWYVFIVLGVPAVFFFGAAIKGAGISSPMPAFSLQALVAALVLMAIKGPVEELGWRGMALPLLQRKLAPFWAGLVLGFIWGIWHLPAFLLSGTQQSAWSFWPFVLGSVALSLIATPLFNASRGSVLLPALFHFQLINPLWPDAQPYENFLFLGVAAVVVWLNRTTMFTRENAATQVIPHAKSSPVPQGLQSAETL
jgi:hypothetical protein